MYPGNQNLRSEIWAIETGSLSASLFACRHGPCLAAGKSCYQAQCEELRAKKGIVKKKKQLTHERESEEQPRPLPPPSWLGGEGCWGRATAAAAAATSIDFWLDLRRRKKQRIHAHRERRRKDENQNKLFFSRSMTRIFFPIWTEQKKYWKQASSFSI